MIIAKQANVPKARNFVDPDSISMHLHCSICMDVYRDPVYAAKCQHTYCRECIESWCLQKQQAGATNKEGVLCPQCQAKKIEKPLRRNDMAYSIINSLPVRCENSECDW